MEDEHDQPTWTDIRPGINTLIELLPQLTPMSRFLVVCFIIALVCFLLHLLVAGRNALRSNRELRDVLERREWRGTWKDISGREAGEISLVVNAWMSDSEFLGVVVIRELCSYRVQGKISVTRSPISFSSKQSVRIALDPHRTKPYRLPSDSAPCVFVCSRKKTLDFHAASALQGHALNRHGELVGSVYMKNYAPHLNYNEFLDVGIDVATADAAIQEDTYWDGTWTLTDHDAPTGKLRLAICGRSKHTNAFTAQLSVAHGEGEGWQSFIVPVTGSVDGRFLQFSFDPRRLELYRHRLPKMDEIPVRFEGYLQNGVMKGHAVHRHTESGALVSSFAFTPQFSVKYQYRNQGVPR